MFPETIIVRIYERLGYSERSCFAFTCKEYARIAVKHGLLQSSAPAVELTKAMDKFFILWGVDLPGLGFCIECGLYRSIKEGFWRKREMAEARKIGGRTAWRWQTVSSQSDIDMAIRCWVSTDPAFVRRAGESSRICPDCAVNHYTAGMLQGPPA